jgi:hypothetical protein
VRKENKIERVGIDAKYFLFLIFKKLANRFKLKTFGPD